MRKGQEEIVGFVLIMVIMAIVLLVFLGIMVRNHDPNVKESKDIYQFLESISEVTTNCQIRSTEYALLGDLFGKCLNEKSCFNDLDSCDVLNSTISELIDSSWNVDSESNIKGYVFESYYDGSGNNSIEAKRDKIINLKNGNCNSSIRGATYMIPAFPGKIINSFKLCS